MSYFLIGYIFLVTSLVYADDDDNMMSCLELFDPEGIDKMCCESMEGLQDVGKDFEECLTHDSEEWMCDDFQCILKKLGMLEDNKIDEDGAKKYYDKLMSEYPKEKSLVERVKRECLDGKYETYPPEDACPAVKFYVCSYINAFLDCDSWKNLDVCSKMAQHAKKCKAVIGN